MGRFLSCFDIFIQIASQYFELPGCNKSAAFLWYTNGY